MDPRTIAHLVKTSTAKQGLPEVVEDPMTLVRVGRILRQAQANKTGRTAQR